MFRWLVILAVLTLSFCVDVVGAGAVGCTATREDVITWIGYAADDVFHVDKRVLFAVSLGESGTNHCRAGRVVEGDGGESAGVFQLHRRGVFNDPRNPYRLLGLDARYDLEINVMFAAWFLHEYGHMCPWTAYRQVYGGCW